MKNAIEVLKKEVEKLLGKSIVNATLCEELSQEVASTTNLFISAQTIRRMWGLVKYTGGTSANTTNTLSVYLGFRDFEDFMHRGDEDRKHQIGLNFEIVARMFKDNKIKESDYNLWHEGMFLILVEFIFANRHSFHEFVDRLYKNPPAMQLVMASFRPHHLMQYSWYMNGLRLFCSHSKISHHRLYLYSIEMIALMLQQKTSEMGDFVPEINKELPKVRSQYGIIFPLEGALYGLLYVYYHQQKMDEAANSLLDEMEAVIKQNINSIFDDEYTYLALVRNFAEILIWAGIYEPLNYFVKKYGLNVVYKRHLNISTTQIQYLQMAAILFQANEKKQALKYFKKVDLKSIRFDYYPIFKIVYQLLELGFAASTSVKKRDSLKALIKQDCNKFGFPILKEQIALYDTP